MKALLLSKYRQLELADVAEPAVNDDEVLVRVAACGICGSDVHGYDGSSGRRIPPIIMGVVIRGVTVGPSPEWIVRRLASVGSRSINNIVDASNYVLHATHQASQ